MSLVCLKCLDIPNTYLENELLVLRVSQYQTRCRSCSNEVKKRSSMKLAHGSCKIRHTSVPTRKTRDGRSFDRVTYRGGMESCNDYHYPRLVRNRGMRIQWSIEDLRRVLNTA